MMPTGWRNWVEAVSILVVLVTTLACSGSDDDGNSGAARACRDTADAVAKAAQRCGQDYQTNYEAFEDAAAAGSCSNVKQIRDESALYDVFIPYFETIECSELLGPSPTFPAECQSQLLR